MDKTMVLDKNPVFDKSMGEFILKSAFSFFGAEIILVFSRDDMGQLNLTNYQGIHKTLAEKYESRFRVSVEGGVMQSRAPLLIPDTSRDARFILNPVVDFFHYTLLSFPLEAHEEMIGVLTLMKPKKTAFNPLLIKKIPEFVRELGKEITGRLQGELAKLQENKLNILNSLILSITSENKIDTLSEKIKNIINEELNLKDVEIILFSTEDALSGIDNRVRRILMRGSPEIINHEETPVIISPVSFGGKILGFIRAGGDNINFYRDIFHSLGHLLGAARLRIMQEEELSSSRSEISALKAIAEYEMSGVLSSSSSLDKILSATLEILIKLLRMERVNIMLYDQQKQELKVRAYWGIDDKPFGVDTLKIGEGVAGHALETGKPYQKNIGRDPVFVESPFYQEEIKSILAYPMTVEGRKIGVINVGSIYKDYSFSLSEMKIMSLVASRAALAVENSRLMKEHQEILEELMIKNKKLKIQTEKLSEKGKKLTETTRQFKKILEESQETNRKLTLLQEFSSRIMEITDIKELPHRILDSIPPLIGDSPVNFLFAVLDRIRGKFDIVATRGVEIGKGIRKEMEVRDIPEFILHALTRDKKPLILDQFPLDRVENPKMFLGVRSFYAFPLLSGEVLWGVVCGFSRKKYALSEKEWQILQLLCQQTALVQSRLNSYIESESRSRKLTLLNKTINQVVFSGNLREKMEKIVELACRLSGYGFSLLLIYEGNSGNTNGNGTLQSYYGIDRETLETFRDANFRKMVEESLRRRKILFSSYENHESVLKYSFFRDKGINSLVILPLFNKNRSLGALILGDKEVKNISEEILNFYELFSSQLSLTLDNALLFTRMMLDKERIESVFNSMKEGVVCIDWERKITVFNKGAEEITGWKEEEVLGNPCNMVFTCSSQRGDCFVSCPLLDILTSEEKGSQGHTTEGFFYTRDKQERFLSGVISLLTRDDSPVGGVIVFRDITEEREYQKRRSDYLSALSHDIFTPLTAIKGYATTLLLYRDKFDEEAQNGFVKIINSEIDRITRLLYNLMSLSKMETDRLKFKAEPHSILPAVRKMVEIYSLNTDKHDFVIDRSLQSLPEIFADPDHTEQILNNLISNGVKYSPSGGKIIIRAEYDHRFVRIMVEDDGIGINGEDLERVFNRYERILSDKTRSVSGMGLGLYITRTLVELQGGKIYAQPRSEGGTRFVFSLPLYQTEVGG